MPAAFLRLWLGQWLSNLGTQISFYGLGLWLLGRSGQFQTLAAVALVVQLGRLLAVPLLTRWLQRYSQRRLIAAAYAVGGLLTLVLAGLLLRWGLAVPLSLVLLLLGLGALAEALLVISFSSLIPALVPPAQLGRANGLFATTDGLVYLVAPFLGALLAARLGLLGVVALDGATFVLALLCVGLGAWPQSTGGLQASAGPSGLRLATRRLWRQPRLAALLLLGQGLMVGFAAAELLFPAWVLAALGPDRLGRALGLSGLAYGLGMLLWQGLAGRRHLWPRVLLAGLTLQACVLVGAGLQWCQDTTWIWLLGVALFNLAVPPVLAAQQSLWHHWVPASQQRAWFAARYAWDWLARLVCIACLGGLVDRWVQPLLQTWAWPWLGQGPGRSLAVTLALVGVAQLCLLACQGRGLLRRDGKLPPCA